MRVLQMISSAGYYGAEAMVVNLSRALERAGCGVVVAIFKNAHCPNRELADRAAALGLETAIVPCSGRLDRKAIDAVRRIIRDRDIDVVQTHGYKANAYGYAAVQRVGTPLMATCHNWVGGSVAGRLYDVLDHLVLRGFAHVSAVSDAVSRSLRRYGVPADRITVIPNGIDVTAFRDGGDAFAEEIRKQGRPAIGLVGRLVLDKGGDRFLRSAVDVLRIRPDALFLLIGDGPARAELETMSRRLGLGGRVIFTGSRTDMPAVYAALDIVVLPSRKEGMPMTVIEAMAAARPVVATRVGALDQVVSDGDTGLLVDETDESEFTRALLSIVNDPVAAAEMGGRARKRAAERFSAETMARQYLELYQRLCPEPALC